MKYEKHIIDLYRIIVDEEKNFLKSHHDRANFFFGIITGLAAGIVIGALKLSQWCHSEWYHYLLILPGPILMICICGIAIKSIDRFYQRFLEAVTMRAKLEYALDMTKPPPVSKVLGPEWVIKDPLVPPRHLKSRVRFKTTEEWIDMNRSEGYNKWLKVLFIVGQFVGLFLIGSIFFLMFKSFGLSPFVSISISIFIIYVFMLIYVFTSIFMLVFKDNSYDDCGELLN